MKNLLLFGSLLLMVFASSCARKSQKTLADYYEQHPGQSQLTPDKRVKARTARENRKRNEYYNSLQHR
jgi:hypothetical protein